MKKTDAERLMKKKQEDPQQGDARFDHICHHERCSNDVTYLASVTNKNMFFSIIYMVIFSILIMKCLTQLPALFIIIIFNIFSNTFSGAHNSFNLNYLKICVTFMCSQSLGV